jgi:hypothetical protein
VNRKDNGDDVQIGCVASSSGSVKGKRRCEMSVEAHAVVQGNKMDMNVD